MYIIKHATNVLHALLCTQQTWNSASMHCMYIGNILQTHYTVVWEKFNAKKFSSLVWYDENWTHEIFLTMNEK